MKWNFSLLTYILIFLMGCNNNQGDLKGQVTTEPSDTGNQISADETGNSTKMMLAAGAIFIGNWENVSKFNIITISIIGNNPTTGTLYIDSSQDGGNTINTVSFNISNTAADFPHTWNISASHARIRYLNGPVAQTGFFQLQTKYSNSLAITSSSIDSKNTTQTPLVASGVFTGAWTDVRNYAEIKLSYDADVPGTNCIMQFSPDGIEIERSILVPPQKHSLQTNFGAVHTLNPILPFFRIIYINGDSDQTNFSLTTMLSIQSAGGLISRSNQIINQYNDVTLTRPISDANTDRNLGLIGYQFSKRLFGLNENLGSNEEFVNTKGTYTFPTTAETLRIASGGDADDDATGTGARSVEITFLDSNYEIFTEILSTNGTAASSTTTKEAIRLLKAQVKDVGTQHGTNIDDIVIENTISGDDLAVIPANRGVSLQAIYTVPAGFTMYVVDILASVGSNNSADILIFQTPNADNTSAPFSSKIIEWSIEDFTGTQLFQPSTQLKFLEKTDVWISAVRTSRSGGKARVSIDLDFYLLKNEG